MMITVVVIIAIIEQMSTSHAKQKVKHLLLPAFVPSINTNFVAAIDVGQVGDNSPTSSEPKINMMAAAAAGVRLYLVWLCG